MFVPRTLRSPFSSIIQWGREQSSFLKREKERANKTSVLHNWKNCCKTFWNELHLNCKRRKVLLFLELAWITLKFLPHKISLNSDVKSEWITPKNRKFFLIAFQSPFSLFRPLKSNSRKTFSFLSLFLPLNHVAAISFQFWWRSIQIPINLSVDLRCRFASFLSSSSSIQKGTFRKNVISLARPHTHTQKSHLKINWNGSV
jgi:hypothetical protein